MFENQINAPKVGHHCHEYFGPICGVGFECVDCNKQYVYDDYTYPQNSGVIIYNEPEKNRKIDKKQEKADKEKVVLEKIQKAVDYYNIRKNMSFMQKLKELFK